MRALPNLKVFALASLLVGVCLGVVAHHVVDACENDAPRTSASEADVAPQT